MLMILPHFISGGLECVEEGKRPRPSRPATMVHQAGNSNGLGLWCRLSNSETENGEEDIVKNWED